MATFETNYSQEPWSSWDINQRDWWVPEVLWAFKQRSNYAALVPTRVDFEAVHTKKMHWTGLWELEPTYDSIADTSIWLEGMHPEGWTQDITLLTYGGKLGLHKYHPLITFFNAGGGVGALRELTRRYVANAMIDQLEILMRNAYLTKPNYFVMGGGNGFSDIAAADLFDPEIALDIGLDFRYMEIADPNAAGGITSWVYATPGQVYAAQSDADWIGKFKYTEFGIQRVANWEVGSYKGINRYLETPLGTLYNAGTLKAHVVVTAAITPGDGAPDPATTTVDGVKKVGQVSAGTPTRYIQLSALQAGWDVGWNTDISTSMAAAFAVGDIITIHTRESPGTTDPYDVQYAPLPDDGTITYRQIVAVDAANARLTVDRPIQKDYTVEGLNDCDAGEYAFVSTGLHIHAAVVTAAPGGVVGAFAQPPTIMFPPAVDDRLAMYRVSWDTVGRYALFRPEVFHLIFSAGKVSKRGYGSVGKT